MATVWLHGDFPNGDISTDDNIRYIEKGTNGHRVVGFEDGDRFYPVSDIISSRLANVNVFPFHDGDILPPIFVIAKVQYPTRFVLAGSIGDYATWDGKTPCGTQNIVYTYNPARAELEQVYREDIHGASPYIEGTGQGDLCRNLRIIGREGNKVILYSQLFDFGECGPNLWGNLKHLYSLDLSNMSGGLMPYIPPASVVEREETKIDQCSINA